MERGNPHAYIAEAYPASQQKAGDFSPHLAEALEQVSARQVIMFGLSLAFVSVHCADLGSEALGLA